MSIFGSHTDSVCTVVVYLFDQCNTDENIVLMSVSLYFVTGKLMHICLLSIEILLVKWSDEGLCDKNPGSRLPLGICSRWISFSWITHVFISCLGPHFRFTITLSASRLSHLAEHRGVALGRWRRGDCSHKGEWYGNYPSRVEEQWWDLLMKKRMEGCWRDEMLKEMQVGRRGIWTAASWISGQPLNSKSTHLIMTCQGCEWRESEGRTMAQQSERILIIWHQIERSASGPGEHVCYLPFHALSRTHHAPWGCGVLLSPWIWRTAHQWAISIWEACGRRSVCVCGWGWGWESELGCHTQKEMEDGIRHAISQPRDPGVEG